MAFKYKHYTIKTLYIIVDFLLIYSAIALACIIRQTTVAFDVSFQTILTNPQNAFRFIFVFWIGITIFFINANALYQTRRDILEGFEIGLVIKSIFLSAMVVIVVIYGLKVEEFPRSILIIGTGFHVLFLSVWRFLKRLFVKYLVARGYNNFNALIIGAGKVGRTLAMEIERRPGLGIQVVGFLDDFKTGFVPEAELKILGKIHEFQRIVKREFINKIFITIHHDNQVFLDLLEQAKDMGLAVRVIPQGFDLISGEFLKYNLGFIPILEYSHVTSLRKQVGKRFFDFLLSIVGLVIVLPVFIILSIIIISESRGSIFYISERYGRNGRIFHMLKFRSMFVDADKIIDQLREKNEVDGPIFKVKKDPRVTRIGRFLRRYSLDELPQLLNVIKGDMSLVGPRPLPIQQIEKEDFKQLKRLEVRPGITGLWQIKGRSDISFSRLVKWDMWYINNWSFWLDITILLQTLPVVIKGRGAY